MTSTNTAAARKTYRTADASKGEGTTTAARPSAAKPKSAGQKVLMVVMLVFGVWRLTVGMMTLLGPSTTASHTPTTADTSSVCYSNPAARGC